MKTFHSIALLIAVSGVAIFSKKRSIAMASPSNDNSRVPHSDEQGLDSAIQNIVAILRPLGASHRRYVLRAAVGRLGAPALDGDDQPEQEWLASLSRRERQIFDFLVDGHSNAQISRALCISVKTVETHRTRIFKKLGVHSAVELLRFAVRMGLLAPNSSAPSDGFRVGARRERMP